MPRPVRRLVKGRRAVQVLNGSHSEWVDPHSPSRSEGPGQTVGRSEFAM